MMAQASKTRPESSTCVAMLDVFEDFVKRHAILL